jgi:hypothetical protein
MRMRIIGLIVGLSAGLAGTAMTITPGTAADLLTTDRQHFSKGPSRGAFKGFSGSTRERRTITVQAQNDTLYAKDNNLIAQAATFDLEASLACREGRLRRLGGGIAEFGQDRFPAGYANHMSRAEGIALSNRLYVFVNESSTACRVYTYGP